MISRLFSKRITISSSTLYKQLVMAFTAVAVAHLTTVAYYFHKVSDIAFGSRFFMDLFFFEFEKNIPSFFSAFLLVLAGYLLRLVYRHYSDHGLKGGIYWKFLSFLFYFLAMDEWFSLHENLNFVESNILSAPSWLLFYLPATIMLGIALVQFLKILPKATLLMFIVSGCIYVMGAAGFEMISSWASTFHFNDIRYQAILLCEDGLEMVGVLLFIKAILQYLATLTVPHSSLEGDLMSSRDGVASHTIPWPARTFSIIFILVFIESVITFIVN